MKSAFIAGVVVILIVLGAVFLFSPKEEEVGGDLSFEEAYNQARESAPEASPAAEAPVSDNEEMLSAESDLQEMENEETPMVFEEPTELVIEDIEIGSGAEVQTGDSVLMHYSGTLLDGTPFDSSYDRGVPFPTAIGVGSVIQGWDQGVPGMKVGGKRRLIIPAELAYGDRSPSPAIPAGSALVFEVELLEIQ